MSMDTETTFEVEREVYLTQWENIRFLWTQTINTVRNLTALVVFSTIPLRIIRQYSLASDHLTSLKHLVALLIFIFGSLALATQINNNARSKQARKVIVTLENKWNLYDRKGVFIFQGNDCEYSYGKFAGGEKRLSHTRIQTGYIIIITIAGIFFTVSS